MSSGSALRVLTARGTALALGFSAGIALAGCSGEPRPVGLALLATQPLDWDGVEVSVSGTLRSYSEPRHYWIEENGRHRVAIENDDGMATLLVGQRVQAEGRFHYSPERGRWISVRVLEPL
jgi:hypothetical protein